MGISCVTTETVLVLLADVGLSWHTVPFHHIHLDFFTHAATQRWKWEWKQTHTHTVFSWCFSSTRCSIQSRWGHVIDTQFVTSTWLKSVGEPNRSLLYLCFYCDTCPNSIMQKPAKEKFSQMHIDLHTCVRLRSLRSGPWRAVSCLFDFYVACSQMWGVWAPFQIQACHLEAPTSHDN